VGFWGNFSNGEKKEFQLLNTVSPGQKKSFSKRRLSVSSYEKSAIYRNCQLSLGDEGHIGRGGGQEEKGQKRGGT